MDNTLRQQQWKFTIGYLIVFVLLLWFFRTLSNPAQPKEMSYSDFLAEISAGHLDEVRITGRQLIGTLKKDQLKGNGKTPVNPEIACTRIPGLDAGPVVQALETQHVRFSGVIESPSWWTGLLISWGPMLLLFLIYGYAMWRMQQKGGGPLSFGRNRAKIHDESDRLSTKFSDVAGVEEAKSELAEIIDFLKSPQKYQKLGGRIPKGVLLVGPPGTGKTLLARAVAGEAGVPFFSISGSEFVEMFVGVGASRVRDLFDQAKLRAPCIVFIDELDAIGKSRSSGRFFGNDEREQTLNQLLVEMDGFDSSKAVIIMAATNTPEVLDPALLRPGRFDRQVVLDRPDMKEREAILRVHTRKLKVSSGVNLQSVAAETPGMVGADLANIVNEAALNAARRDAAEIEMPDFDRAVDRVTLGFEKKGRLISQDEKERVAFHEVGHTLVALSVPHADPVRRVSIIPRSIGALGHTLQLPGKDRYLQTGPELEDRIAVLLGGRGAEEMAFHGVVSTGASDDLSRASEMARQMVTRYGMSGRMGNLTYGIPHESRFLNSPFAAEERNYGDQVAGQIDAEVRRIVDAQYERVRSILTERRAELDLIAATLLKKETLEREELEKLLAQRKPELKPEPAIS